MPIRQDNGQRELVGLRCSAPEDAEGGVRRLENARGLPATVDTGQHKLCFALSAVLTVFNAVASVSIRHILAFSRVERWRSEVH